MGAPLRDSARFALAASVLVLTACQFSFSAGGPNYEKLENGITDELNTAYAPISREVSSVSCPRDQPKPSPGDTFICTADIDGEPVRVEVTVEDDDGNVRFSTLDVVFDMADTARSLDEKIEAQVGFPVTVECGEGLKIVPIGESFTCTAADRRSVEKTVEVTAESDGKDSWRIVD